MTHNEQVRDMLLTRPYVKISDLRAWCNYRSRIADCRSIYGMRIEPIILTDAAGNKIHAYKFIKPLPVAIQQEMFVSQNHDGCIKEFVRG